jgi:ATP-binding cassette, subfamily C, bacterial LapB
MNKTRIDAVSAGAGADPGGGAGDENVASPSAAWAGAIVLAARRLGVACSPESVHIASAWDSDNSEQAVVDVAFAAGLAGQFADIRIRDAAKIVLPALVMTPAGQVGVITSIAGSEASLQFMVDDNTLERAMPLKELAPSGALRLLLLSESRRVRDERASSYISESDRTWLRNIFARNWNIFIELGLGSLFGNLLAIATSLFAMQVWDRVVPARSINTLWVLATGVGLALILELLIRTARAGLGDRFGKQADLQLSAMFFSRLLDIRNDARPRSPGTLISQLRDMEQLRELLTSSTLGVLIDLPFVAAFLFIIWLLGGPLVYVPLAAIPLLIIPGLIAQVPLARMSNEGLNEAALRNAILMEAIYRVEDIKVLQAEPRFRRIWNNVNKVSGDIGLRQKFLSGLLVNFSQMIQQLAYVGVIIMGVYGILDGAISFGAVLACSILTSRTIAPLSQISGILGRLQNARIGKKALDGLLKLPLDHDPGKDAYHKPSLTGSYRFENVVYAYGPEDKPALTIPQLRIEPGERIAILGRVGAGKSTLLRIAGGLATPVQGQILFNDTNMGMIDVSDVRRDIGFVFQDSSLFYGSLRENLLIGNPTASDAQILEAMRISCADQLLLNQPHGLDLKLREGGLGLSGGQKQALVLARALLRPHNVLLMDEPTASLDETTEAAIIENLKKWCGKRTVILATHRYAPLALVNRIIVIDGGRIVRDGPKDEILGALSGPQGARTAPASHAKMVNAEVAAHG